MLQRQYYFFGTYFLEEHILACWEKAAKGASIILDVGANAGIYSLAALASEPRACVHAFEPTPEIAARLRATATLNALTRLHVHEMAVSERSGHAVLAGCRGDLGSNEGMNFIRSNFDEVGLERVQSASIDDFCEQHAISHIDLMKLDIQGHEYHALIGARRLIGRGRIGAIFMELNWVRQRGHFCPAARSISLLEQAGYRFARPADDLSLQKSGEWLHELSDVVACLRHPC
jgi:FkbM family methyltransferase